MQFNSEIRVVLVFRLNNELRFWPISISSVNNPIWWSPKSHVHVSSREMLVCFLTAVKALLSKALPPLFRIKTWFLEVLALPVPSSCIPMRVWCFCIYSLHGAKICLKIIRTHFRDIHMFLKSTNKCCVRFYRDFSFVNIKFCVWIVECAFVDQRALAFVFVLFF